MAFDLNTAIDVNPAPAQQPENTNTGFDMNTAQDVPAPESVILHEDSGKVVGVPAGMNGDEADYAVKTQVQSVPKENFWGTTFVPDAVGKTIDYAGYAAKGFGAFTAETAPRTAGALTQEFGERGAAAARGDDTGGNAVPTPMDVFLPISTDPDSFVNQAKAAAYQRVADAGKSLVAKSADFVKSLGLDKPKDATTAQGVFYDIGSGMASVGYSIAATLLTRNPIYASAFFGSIQKGSIYLEGREKGMSPEAAGKLSTDMGVVNGAMEALGNSLFMKIGEASTPLRRIAMRIVEESTQEGLQQTAEEVQANVGGLRDTTFQQGLRNVTYASFLGAVAGAPVASVVEIATREGNKQGIPPEQSAAIAERVVANGEEVANAVADELQKGEYRISVDPKLQTEAGNVLKKYAAGQPVSDDVDQYITRRANAERPREDTVTMMLERGTEFEPLTMRERDTSRVDDLRARMAEPFQTQETIAGGRLRMLDTQVAAIDTEIDQLMTTMDTRQDAGRPNVATTNRLNRLLAQRDRLDAQRGDLLTRSSDEVDETQQAMDEAMGRQQVQVRGDTIRRLGDRVVSERTRALEAGLREGRRMALTDVKAAQDFIVDTLDSSDLTAADKAKFITTVKNIQTPEQAEKQLPVIQSRIGRLVEKQAQRDAKAAIKKALEKTKVRKQSGKPVGKFTPDLQVMFDKMRSIIKMKPADASALLDSRLASYDTAESMGPTPEETLENALLSIVSSDHEIASGKMLDTLETVNQLVTEGRADGLQRLLARQQEVAKLKQDAYQALTGDKVNKFNEFEDRLRLQLVRTGMDPEESAINAEATRAAYQSFSKRSEGNTALQEVVDNAFQRLTVQQGTAEQGDDTTLFQSARNIDTEEFKVWFGNSKVVNEDGTPKVLYHGSQRPDRLADAGKFDKTRANSGPMAFFTDDPSIASNYASGKTDTSIESFDASDHLTINGIKGNIDKAWNSLPATQRVKIRENAWRVGRDEDTGEIGLTEDGLSSKDHFTWVMQRESGNNPLKALYKNWVEGGEIFNEEGLFVDVLGALGIKATYEDPYAVRSGVLPVYLSVQNPLITNAIPAEVVIALDEASQTAPMPEEGGFGVDQWDKRFVSPQDWMTELKSDIASGTNSYAWTRIPDWVTETLTKMGYDGVQDTGGKMGGEGHDVWIPFEEGQVKSVFNRGTFDASNPNILYQSEFSSVGQLVDFANQNDVDLGITRHSDGTLDVYRIIASEKGQGSGSKVMQAVIDYADSQGSRIVLTPDDSYGATSVNRLKKFYKRFGFVENKGRNKDFAISDAMYREPQLRQNNMGLARGSITLPKGDAGAIIRLFGTANKSTFLHETGHFYWTLMEQMAQHPDATAEIKADVSAVRNLVGATGPLTVEQHERIAEDFEKYLETGKAPTPVLKKAFAAFKDWLGQIYASIKNRTTDIAPEMRGVFDKWFAGAEELPQRYNRGMQDRASFGARASAAGREAVGSAYGAFNSWQDTLSYVFGKDKSGAGATILKDLGTDVSALFQKRKGVVRAATERFTNEGMRAFGFTNQKQFMDQLTTDSKRIDLGTFYNAAGKETRMQMTKSEARKRWMELQDPTLVDTITSPNGNAYSTAMLDALDAFLTPQDKAFAQAQLDFYRWFYPQVNSVYANHYGVNLPNNPMYSPIAREHFDVNNPMFSQDVAYRRSVAPGSLKSRVATLNPLKDMSDFATLQRHIAEMSHFMTFADKVQELGAVFGDPTITGLIQDQYSQAIMRNIKDYMQDFRSGQIRQLNENVNALEKMRQNFTVSVLGLKPALAVKNFTSFLTYAEFMPAKDFAVGLADFAKNPQKAAKILGESELLKARRKTLDRDIALAYKSSEFGAWRGKQTFVNAMMWFTQAGDIASIVAGGWPVYRYNRSVLGKSHEESLRAFEDATALTRSSSDLDQLSRLQASPSVLARSATMLMSDTNQLYRRETRAILDGLRGNISKADMAKKIALYHLVIPMFYQFVADFGEWDPENQLRAAIWGSLNGAFILYDILDSITRYLQGDKVFSKTNPAVQWAADVGRGVSKMTTEEYGTDEFTEGFWKMLSGVGSLVGVPVARIPQTLQGIEEISQGEVASGSARVLGFPNSVADRIGEDNLY